MLKNKNWRHDIGARERPIPNRRILQDTECIIRREEAMVVKLEAFLCNIQRREEIYSEDIKTVVGGQNSVKGIHLRSEIYHLF